MKQNKSGAVGKVISNHDKKINNWKKSLNDLEKKINYSFKNKKLLEDALTHKSFKKGIKTNKSPVGNKSETMEFLGDSVLELIVSEFLYNKFPDENEGNLSKIRSKIISRNFLYKKSKEIGLSKYILIGDNGLKNKLRKNISINSDAMESLFAAIFLDSSYVETKYIIENTILSNWEDAVDAEDLKNFKSYLQEWSQAKFGENPEYEIIKASGPEHRKKFYVKVKVIDKYKSKGNGKTKKAAEQNAAMNLVKRLKIIEKI